MSDASYDHEYSVSDYIEEIEHLMSDGDFQRSFFESLKEQFERKGTLSEKQTACLIAMFNRVYEWAEKVKAWEKE